MPENKNNHNDENDVTRRDFLEKIAIGSLIGAGTMAFLGIVQLPLPKVLNEPPSLFKIGMPTDFPVNSYFLIPGKNVFILRDLNGVRALSAICTHLGCIVKQAETGFLCPCHGSVFDNEGNIISGPAPRGMDWHLVGMAPDGKLTVDMDKKVDKNIVYPI